MEEVERIFPSLIVPLRVKRDRKGRNYRIYAAFARVLVVLCATLAYTTLALFVIASDVWYIYVGWIVCCKVPGLFY